MDFWW